MAAFDGVIDNLWRATVDDNANVVGVGPQVVMANGGNAATKPLNMPAPRAV